MIFTRPFKDRIINILIILVEFNVAICYSASGLLLFSELDHDIIIWVVLGSIYLSYLLHSALGYYKIYTILSPIIRAYYSRRAKNNIVSTKYRIDIERGSNPT
jgi:hypothetical protein